MAVNELVSDEIVEENHVIFSGTRTFSKKIKQGALIATVFGKNVKPRSTPLRIEDYVERVVPSYKNYDFKCHFRMSRTAVEKLILIYGAAVSAEKNLSVAMEKRVLTSLWLLATPDSFRSIGDRFNLSKGNTHYIFMEFIRLICRERKNFIAWPTEETMVKTKTFCEEQYDFPGVVGAVDGCHIDIKEPEENKNAYYNRKKRTSILLQGICNEQLMFIDVCAGWPGSVHDARMWRSSFIYDCVKSGLRKVSDGHLLGDSAYPLEMFIMTPYKDNGHLTAKERNYNKIHSSARQMIERGFALLKGRFRRLKYLDMSLIAQVSEVIMSACILHNFILIQDGNNGIEDYIGDINLAPPTADIVNEAENLNPVADGAKIKQRTIADRLRPRDGP